MAKFYVIYAQGFVQYMTNNEAFLYWGIASAWVFDLKPGGGEANGKLWECRNKG